MSFTSVMPQVKYKIDELEKLMDIPPLKEGSALFEGEDYNICYDNVCFGYDEKEILHHVCLNLKPNTKTAFVGESGSGKSTLMILLWNFQMVFRLLLAREAQAYQEEKNNVFLLRALF